VHRTVCVLENLAGFGNFHARSAHDFHNGVLVHRTRQIAALLIESTNDLRNRGSLVLRIARIFTLRTERQKVVDPTLETGLLEDGPHVHARRRRVCRAFKHDELSWTERLGNRTRSAFDVAQIWIAALIERGRHTDDDAVSLGESS